MGNEGDIKLHPQWLDVLGVEFEKDYMRTLRSFLLQRKQQQAVIYPPGSQWFSALNTTPLDQVRGNFRSGSLPWPWPSSWSVFFGAS